MVKVSDHILGKARENIGVSSLERMMYNRRPQLHEHSVHVAERALSFGEAWGLPERDLYTLGVASLLHDVGQMHWRPYQFSAPKQELTEADLAWMRLHPRFTFNRVRVVDEEAARIAVEHHEWQRDAYPRRNPQQGFNLLSHMLILADKFEALLEPRAYRDRSFSLDKAASIVVDDYTGSPLLLHQYVEHLSFHPDNYAGFSAWRAGA